MAAGIYCHSTTPVATPLVGTVQELEKQGWRRDESILYANCGASVYCAARFRTNPGQLYALRSLECIVTCMREIVKDAGRCGESRARNHLLGQTKAKVDAIPMEVVYKK